RRRPPRRARGRSALPRLRTGRRGGTGRPPPAPRRGAPRARAPARRRRAPPAAGTPSGTPRRVGSTRRGSRESARPPLARRRAPPSGLRWPAAAARARGRALRTRASVRSPSRATRPRVWGRGAGRRRPGARQSGRERSAVSGTLLDITRMSQSPRSSRPPLLGRRIAVTRARDQADELVRALEALGADVVAAPMIRIQALADLAPLRAARPVYATVREAGDGTQLARDVVAGGIDAITFTSSSTVRHFVDIVGREAATSGRFAAAAIGPVTAEAARELGIQVAIEAREYTVPGLVEALVRYFGEEGSGKRDG